MLCQKCNRPINDPEATCVYCGHNPAVGALGGMPPGDPPVHVPSAGVFVPADSIEGELKVGYTKCPKTLHVGKHAAPVGVALNDAAKDEIVKVMAGSRPLMFPRAVEKRNGVLVVNFPRGSPIAFQQALIVADQVEKQCGVKPVVCPRSGDSFPTVEWVEFGATRKYQPGQFVPAERGGL